MEKVFVLTRHLCRQIAQVFTPPLGLSALSTALVHVLLGKESYNELGGDNFDKRNVEVQRNRLVRQLESPGLKLTLEALPGAA